MIWPFTERYQMICLQWPGRSNFWILWSFHETPGYNLRSWGYQLRSLVALGTGSRGCVCGWKEPVTKRWPSWFWRNKFWNAHVKDCPVERDEQGNVVDWQGYR